MSGPSNTTEQRSPARSNLHCKVENIPKVGVPTSSQQQIPPSCHILPSSHVLPSSHIIPSSHVLQSKHPLIHPPVHNSIPPSCHAQSVHPSHGLPSKPGFYPHPAHLGKFLVNLIISRLLFSIVLAFEFFMLILHTSNFLCFRGIFLLPCWPKTFAKMFLNCVLKLCTVF